MWLHQRKIALYGAIIGIALMVIPLFSIVLQATGASGAVITIDATNKDIAAIKSAINSINAEMVKQEVGPCGSGWEVNGQFTVDPATAEGIIMEIPPGQTVVNLSINNKVYNELDMAGKEKYMSIALNGIQNSSISVINRNKIYSFIANSDKRVSGLVRQLSEDVSVDMPAAYAWFRPFSSPLSVFLGCVTIAIFALLGISTVVDISFLTIPGVQWLLIRKSSENEKPRFVSLEAWEAYKHASITHEGVLGLFFKKKAGQMIVLGICVLYLVSGNLFALVAKIVDYFQGLVNTFFLD